MKNLHTFEEFLNEDKALRITIDANLWKGGKPESKPNYHGEQFLLYSNDVLDNYYNNILNYNNVVVIVAELSKGEDTVYLKVGYGSEDDKKNKLFRSAIGNFVIVTIDELKADPKGVAKKVSDLFIEGKKYFEMNFYPHNKRAIFAMGKDLEKPALELVEFAIKNIK